MDARIQVADEDIHENTDLCKVNIVIDFCLEDFSNNNILRNQQILISVICQQEFQHLDKSRNFCQ